MLDFISILKGNKKGLIECNKKTIDMVIDSAIIGGIALFAIWDGHAPSIDDAFIMLKAFGSAFVLQLAFYRGVKSGK